MSDTSSSETGTGQGGTGGDGGGGGDVAPWYDGLADDLKAEPNVTRYATPEDAARALVHFNKHFGVPENQLVRLPKPDDAEGNGAFWNTLGRPETPDKYGVDLPEGSALDKDALSGFLASMHKAGPFTPAMAKAALGWYADFDKQVAKAAVEADNAARAKAVDGLKAEWGADYKTRLDEAGAVALKFGGEDLKKWLDDTGAGDDPRVLKAWYSVAEAMREAGPPPDERGRDTRRPMTPSEAQAELARIGTDPEISKALSEANHPQHDYWVKRRLDLFAMAKPDTREGV